MAVDFCDNFNVYGPGGTGFMTNGVYAELANAVFTLGCVADPDGISTPLVWTYNSGNNNGENYNLRKVLSGGAQDIVGVAQRVWLDQLPRNAGAYPKPIEFRDNGNTLICSLGVSTTGQLFIQNAIANEQYITAGPVITANGWWHIETRIQISTGQYEVRVEGVTVLSGGGKNFGANPIAQTAFGSQNAGATVNASTSFIKDFVVWTGAGAHNTDFLGTVIVALLTPNADVALNWTPTPAGHTGSSILANIPPQDGVQYIDAPNPPPAAFVCAMSDLTPDVTSVKAIMTMVRAQKTDGGDASLQSGIISSPLAAPATVLGANRPITVGQTYWMDVFEVDPKTGAAWLPSAVNAANFQLNRTT